MNTGDTIVAISSAVGTAVRMIVRLSGPDAFTIASSVIVAPINVGHAVVPVRLRWDRFTIPALAYCFAGPRSSTSEDVVELHIPGNPLLAKSVLAQLVSAGARQAEAGEFSARAYFNGRIDLTQAEGISVAVSAANEAELRAARQLLAGELATRLKPAIEQLAGALALVEVGIDFTEEDVMFITPQQLGEQLQKIDADLQSLVSESTRFDRLTHEPTFALLGWPNAGKSTLLNALAGQQRAVVSDVAGTTRDAVWAEVVLPRGLVRMIDVAGIELTQPSPDDTTPPAEIVRQMRRRAEQAIASADFILQVHPATAEGPPPAVGRPVDCVVRTKTDQSDDRDSQSPRLLSRPLPEGGEGQPDAGEVRVSALTGDGIALLKDVLDRVAFGRPGGATLALNQRHINAIAAARAALRKVIAEPQAAAEISALHLRSALDELGAVTGQITPDDVLGRVFSTFCIGK